MASKQEGAKTPQWQGVPEVIRDTQQLARQSYTRLSAAVTLQESNLLTSGLAQGLSRIDRPSRYYL